MKLLLFLFGLSTLLAIVFRLMSDGKDPFWYIIPYGAYTLFLLIIGLGVLYLSIKERRLNNDSRSNN